MAVLHFSFNFDVVVQRGESHVCLPTILTGSDIPRDLVDNKLNTTCTMGNKPSQYFDHIFQALFLRLENSKLHLTVTVNSSLCQMILAAYLYSKYKQLKMFTLSSNGSHVSNTMGGKRIKLSSELKLKDTQYLRKICLTNKNALFTYTI